MFAVLTSHFEMQKKSACHVYAAALDLLHRYLLLPSLVTSRLRVLSSAVVLRIGPASPCQQLVSYLKTYDSVPWLLLFFIIYTMCPTQSRVAQFWKPRCNSIHIKAANLSASPSPKSSIFTARPPWAYLLLSCLLPHKKLQHFYSATCGEVADLIYKLSLVFPFSVSADYLAVSS